MLAVVQRGYGAPDSVLQLERAPLPSVGEHEVRVRMHSTSVNTPDWLAITGMPYVLRPTYGWFGPRTPIRGTDVAGVVDAVGAKVTRFRAGDSVFGSTWNGKVMALGGTFAEYAVAPEKHLTHKPESLSFHDVSCVMSGMTAYVAMREVAQVAPGMRVLINGASGGVGTYAVQIAKHLGAHVIGVCSTRNLELVSALGADEVVDYTREDFTQRTRALDVVLDDVLNHPAGKVRQTLAAGGCYLPNSVGSGPPLWLGLPRMLGAAFSGLYRGDVKTAHCQQDAPRLDAFAQLLGSGALRTVIDRSYPLVETARAVAHMLSHRARGNLVIDCTP